ncbi:MAG TPA: GMC family oxidoreductase N-terminal domain-containing protein [Acidimicrobiales bacterium]
MNFDDIIIGGGSAGLTLAARLSEEPSRRILVIEAGGDFTAATEADHLHGINFALTQRDWGLNATVAPGRVLQYSQGKAAGGGSAVNGGLFIRAVPDDFDGWAAAGNDQWAWSKMLPALRRLEHDQQFGGELHGQDGPMPVDRWAKDDLVSLQRAFLDACTGAGFEWTDDHNDPSSTGIGPFPMNRKGDLRVSTAMAYLAPARDRGNLTVWTECRAVKVAIEGGRAVGVIVERDGQTETVAATRVVISAGAVQTPALLWRSGIGPAPELADLGIACVVDNPAVGANLMEHPGTFLFVVPQDDVCDPEGPQYQIGVRYTAPRSAAFNDMLLSIMNFWDLSASPDFQKLLGVPMVFAVTCGVHQPRSRGRVSLTSADHRAAPAIDLNLLSDPADLAQLVDALRLCHQVATSAAMAPMMRSIALLDEAAIDDDEALAAYIRATVAPWYHVSGTCKMGPGISDGAVVGQNLAVHGVDGLRVVDASVFPMIPRAPTNLTTIAVAERAAELDGA